MMTGICGQLCTKLFAGNVEYGGSSCALSDRHVCRRDHGCECLTYNRLRCRRRIPCVAATIEAEYEVTVRFAGRAVPGKSG